jgi:hypothetical protein
MDDKKRRHFPPKPKRRPLWVPGKKQDETKDKEKKDSSVDPPLPSSLFFRGLWKKHRCSLLHERDAKHRSRVVTTSVTFLRAKRENVRLNHENCVFGWNRGFFHVRERQRYARCVVRAFVFLERFAFFFSRALLRDVRVTAPRSVWGERRHRGAKKSTLAAVRVVRTIEVRCDGM